VLERTDAGLVYAQSSLDLTNELIRKYNGRYGGVGGAKKSDGKAASPASKPAAKK